MFLTYSHKNYYRKLFKVKQSLVYLPNRVYARILQDVGPVEVEEDAAYHDHLSAVRSPAVVHALEEHLPVHAL